MAEKQVELSASFGADRSWPDIAPKEIGEMGLIQKAMAEERKLVRTLYEGTQAMRDAGKEWLPQEPGESNEAYDHRLKRTFLYNAVARTSQVLVGKPFSRPISIGDDVPEKIQEWFENIDNTGRNLNIFSRDVFLDGLLDGISYFLVDMQAAPKDRAGNVVKLRRDQAKKMDRRVYWVQFCADDVLGVHYEIRNGRPYLTQVRLKIEIPAQEDELTQTMVEGVHILVPGGYAFYVPIEDDEEGKYKLVDAGPTTLDYIPFVPVYTGRVAFFVARPPLLDLAWLNLAHWQSSSDQRHILHVARVPILFAKGFELAPGEQLQLGPNRLISQSNDEASLEYVEIEGSAIEAGRQDLVDLQEMMGDFAMRLLTPKTGDATATQTGIEAAEAHSALQAMAEGLEDALEMGSAMTADLAGLTQGGGSLEVYKDFWVSGKDTEIARVLSEAEEKKQISLSRMWTEWQRRDILGSDFDEDAEQEALEQQASEDLEAYKPPQGFQPTIVEGGEDGDTESATPTPEVNEA